MGALFDPEKFCNYTGLRLYPFAMPCPVPGGGTAWRIGYWREDGHLRRVRDATGEESAWIAANPAKVRESETRFRAWLASKKSNS